MNQTFEAPMPSIGRLAFLTALALAFLVQGRCWSQAQKTEIKAEQLDRKKVESLIAQLRSTNKNPFVNGDPWRVKFPDDYDEKAQEKVEAARQKLIDLGKDAFPILIEHINDEGYSRPCEGSAIPSGESVGYVCLYILEEQVDLAGMRYKSRTGVDGEPHGHVGFFSQFYKDEENKSQNAMRRWWKEHKHLSLREMQIEALRWSIAQERRIGFPDKKDEKSYLQPLLQKLKELDPKGSEGEPKQPGR